MYIYICEQLHHLKRVMRDELGFKFFRYKNCRSCMYLRLKNEYQGLFCGVKLLYVGLGFLKDIVLNIRTRCKQ